MSLILIRRRPRLLKSGRSICQTEIQPLRNEGKRKNPVSGSFSATSRLFSSGKKSNCATKNDEVSWELCAWVGLFGTIGFTLRDHLPRRTKIEKIPSFNTLQEKEHGLGIRSRDTEPVILATSSSIEEAERCKILDDEPEVSDQVDFVIVGYGNAGQEAAKALQKSCPNASIMIIDPNIVAIPQSDDTSITRMKNMKTLFGSAIGLDHDTKTVLVFEASMNDNKRYKTGIFRPSIKKIRFDQSVLIATGSRGAPPPKSLIDERVKDRLLELRSTNLLPLHQYYSYTKLFSRQLKAGESSDMVNQRIEQENIDRSYPLNPVLPPQGVRGIASMAASQGARICILGSGLDAIDLAATCILAKNDSNDPKKDASSISLVFGSPSPLSTILPRYLCTAVSKRLKAIGIEIEDRSLIRYLSFKDGDKNHASDNLSIGSAVEVHVEKSSDRMDTHRRTTDLVIVAPSKVGLRGSAVIPTLSKLNLNSLPQLDYQPWSKLTPINQPAVSCFEDDGRIIVNSEMCAASDIYAAGSVAKYPNHITGHAEVAGEGTISGPLAGQIAANNMAKNYYTGCARGDNPEEISSRYLSQEESLPVWRSDGCSGQFGERSALFRVGINALCVGQCDSEIYGTHGFWWTNHQKRITHRRQSNKGANNPNDYAKFQKWPVYGSGIVFYLDRAGAIRGVMVWGLPFTNHSSKGNTLNEALVGRMKNAILTNGEALVKEHTSVIMDKQQDPDKLQVVHLSEESRILASIAVSSTQNSSHLTKISLHKRFRSRPLYRYINPKPTSLTSLGQLKRRQEIGHGSTGEDIFARRDNINEKTASYSRHPSLVYVPDPLYDFQNPKNGKDQDYNARPSKEELLWKRQNETNKSLAVGDVMSEIFMQNIMKGQFNDGSDAVKQAPVPVFLQDARKFLNDCTSTNDNKGEESNGNSNAS